MFWFAIFFFLSGLCSIVYELVWLRLAMAEFGVTTALVSIVLSVFMAGLGAGSWIGGWATRRYGERIMFSALRLYGFIELLIGVSALVVPLELTWGSHLLERMAGQVSISSSAYYLMSGSWLAVTLIPWCTCMGSTIPVAMFAIRRFAGHDSQRSFSFLYLANVVGAVGGAVVAPALIELYGFRGTLRTGASLNALIFVSALALSLALAERSSGAAASSPASPATRPQTDNSALLLLFTTGLTTMGMEVIWIRLYTYFVGPVVYSFAKILAAYLAATFIGSKIYRYWSRRPRDSESRLVWISLAFLGLLPLLTADSRLHMAAGFRVLLGIAPFAGGVGFLSPMLVDRWSGGNPDRAGRAYAINVLGCIAGPLVAGFVLLPLFGEQVSMLLFVLPWFAMAVFAGKKREATTFRTAATTAAFLIAALSLFFFTRDYEDLYPDRIILRDSTATVIASSAKGNKELLVNGVGMTVLSPLTKMMAHFTFTHLAAPPRNALIICFGMGTTFRSAMSWGIPVTAVELVPSVPKLFTYYHPDGAPLLASPRAHVVIDDGRRFLDRSSEKFDAIIIDPPPPPDAAGSSLLYSREFYLQIRDHLSPGGILQQWLYLPDDQDKTAITRALMDVFPNIQVYESMGGYSGLHYFASMSPIPELTASELVARMPPEAVIDMMEWGPGHTPNEQFDMMLIKKRSTTDLLALAPGAPTLVDDRPINEYNRLRHAFPQLMSSGARSQ
jgi:spermidine synthase